MTTSRSKWQDHEGRASGAEYAAHFARLKPLLYSETGRCWDGAADRLWFPNEGLVFAVQADRRYTQNGSLWIFRVAPNARGDAIDGNEKQATRTHQLEQLVEEGVNLEHHFLLGQLNVRDTGVARMCATTIG